MQLSFIFNHNNNKNIYIQLHILKMWQFSAFQFCSLRCIFIQMYLKSILYDIVLGIVFVFFQCFNQNDIQKLQEKKWQKYQNQTRRNEITLE